MQPSDLHLRLAARTLRRGGVVAAPTEAVWGLSADPLNRAAVAGLLQMKQRGATKGLIVIASCLEQLGLYIEAPSRKALLRATATWPGPHTWVFPASPQAPTWVTGGRSTIAVRVTAHAPMAALCDAFGGALVSTSANRSGQPPCRSAAAVRLRFGPDLILLPGATGGRTQPTTIREVATGNILRR
jgi:L-threonylcarbamoyladenylate synthase